MNARFLLILLLVVLALLGWTCVHYQYLHSRQFRLDQLTELPVYVYLNDPAQLDSLYNELLREIPQIDSLARETGLQAAEELLQAYPDLGIQPNTLREYRLPNILTLYFEPSDDAFRGRDKALALFEAKGLNSGEVDSQEPAWSLAGQELDFLNSRWSVSTLYIALLVFLLLVFARLYLYLAEARASLGMRATVLETIKAGERAGWQSALLIAAPLILSVGLYYLLVALGTIRPLASWTFFAVQLAAVAAAMLVAWLLHRMNAEQSPGAHAITVSNPSRPDA